MIKLFTVFTLILMSACASDWGYYERPLTNEEAFYANQIESQNLRQAAAHFEAASRALEFFQPAQSQPIVQQYIPRQTSCINTGFGSNCTSW